jgi:hypothetical protein
LKKKEGQKNLGGQEPGVVVKMTDELLSGMIRRNFGAKFSSPTE